MSEAQVLGWPDRYMIGNIVDDAGKLMVKVKVPMLFDGVIPDVPKIITKNGWYAELIETNLLTYRNVDVKSAVEVETIK